MLLRRLSAIIWAISSCLGFWGSVRAQQVPIPTGDQLDQLVAPVALFPDPLLAQICAASVDPQQILDVNNWLEMNRNLQGQALTDAAQRAGFDPAFVSLVNFPEVLGMMAANINDFAALGAAFQADQGTVMDSVQRLRQKAFATGVLDSNEYQTVSVQNQGSTQVVIVQPANPQVIFVPQYDPVNAFAFSPSTSDMFGASLVGFGSGIVLGAWLGNNAYPWYWGGWGWGWGARRMVWRGSPWLWHPVYRPPRRWFTPRPPVFRPPPPAWGRPPNNWAQRPGWRPPPAGWRPVGPGAGGRPPVVGTRPPGGGVTRPPGRGEVGTRPPGQGGGITRPPGQGGGANVRPPGPGGGGARPPGEGAADVRPPRPEGAGNRPPGQGGRPSQPTGRPAPQPSVRPAPQAPVTPTPQPRPAPRNSFAGRGNQQPRPTGGRQGAFARNSDGAAARAASNRGRTSAGAPRGGGRG